MRALVLTISDRDSAGECDERSGAAVEQALRRAIVNLPGSGRGATFAAEVVAPPLLGHAVRMIAGEGR